jgi:tight adherence protein B
MSDGMMIFVAMIFVTVFLLVQGLVVPVFGEGAKARKRLQKKLNEIRNASEGEGFSSLLRERYLRRLRPWERQLEQLPAMESLAVSIEQAGKQYLAYRVVLLAAVLAVATALVLWSVLRMEVAAFGLGLVAGWLLFMTISWQRNKRMAKIEEQLPDAIDTMTRALKAGHPFNATPRMIADDMDEPVAKEFELTFGDINYGNDLRRAMLGLLHRVPSVTMMALVTSVLVQKETGGNLAEILKQISTVIRGRFRFHRKVKTLSAEGRMSAWVLALVPLTLFATISVTTPDYLPVLVEDPRGQKLIIYGMISGVLGILWIRRILRIEV